MLKCIDKSCNPTYYYYYFKDENNNVKHLGRNTTGFVISNENITDPFAK